MKTSEFLIKAKSYIDSPEKWTTGRAARNKEGFECGVSEGYCFCSLGAVMKAEFDMKVIPDHRLDNYLYQVMGNGIAIFNDSHSHAEVMEAWDRAIALAVDMMILKGRNNGTGIRCIFD